MVDSADVDLYRTLNPFDAISRATPPGGVPATVTWAAPQRVDYGAYVLLVEASQTYDFNGTYNETTFPSPDDIPWSEYGKAWRGQPSIVYRVPLSIAETASRGTTTGFVGYGDPTGQTGTLNPPDATITTDTPGSGASRLQLVSDGSEMFRVRVRTKPEVDAAAPSTVMQLRPTAVGARTATIAFFPSGDDGDAGSATGYEVRVRAGSPITADNFFDSLPVASPIGTDNEGNVTVTLTGLLPLTDYYVGVRAYDNCFNRSEVTVVRLTTLDREVAEVDWCFVATAAYGSVMANDVGMLRHFRDSMLSGTALGQLAIGTYYTFGPAVAGIVGESDLIRRTTRAVLAPIVRVVRSAAY
jgi:hypothetical protein